MRDYQKNCDYRIDKNGRTDRQTPDKVIPMCRYASQAKQKSLLFLSSFEVLKLSILKFKGEIPYHRSGNNIFDDDYMVRDGNIIV